MRILSQAGGRPWPGGGTEPPGELVWSPHSLWMASRCHQEIIYTRLVPGSRPQRPKRRQLPIKESPGKGARREEG